MNKIVLFVGILILAGQAIYPAETGKPFMTIYTAKETGGHFQNWSFMQDDRGVIYIGNGFGVQEFDGSTWRMILSPNQSFARAFAKDANGRIYVGSLANFGYLAADDYGSMQYVSLMKYIKSEDQAFNYIRTVRATPEGIYFQAQEILFRFRPSAANGNPESWQVQVWRPKGNFSYTFWVDQSLYVHQIGIGLMKMVGDSLVLIPGSQQFTNDRIQIMLPFPGKPGHYLLGTYSRGLFTWDGNSFQPFPTDSDALLLDGPLYVGAVTPDSCFALGSTSTGFFVIDINGKTKLHLTQESGFTSNTVICLYVDKQKNIWVGMDGSIAVLEYSSPLSLFDVAPGSGANDFYRYKGVFYAATNDGVYFLDNSDSKFKHVSGVAGNAQAFYFSEINNELHVPTGSGIYRLEGTKASLALQTNALSIAFNCLTRSKQDSNIVFGGMLNGLGLLRYDSKNPNRLSFIARVAGVHEYISRNVIETEPGVIWPSAMDVGAIRLKFDGKNFLNPMIERFGSEQGLPVSSVTVFRVLDRLAYVAKQGVYKFNSEEKIFSRDPLFDGVNLGRNPDEGMIVADKDSNVWANLGKESVLLKKQTNGTYQLHKEELARFSDEPATVIYPEENGAVWFGTANYAIRYAPGNLSIEQASFPALIRCVSFANDSIIYNGTQTAKSYLNDPTRRLIPFRLNALRFDFSAPSYLNPRENQFRTRLEGFDKSWSAWSRDTRRNYTNLPAGKYRFCVQARNIYNQESEEAIYAFTIQHPWYATWWAWFCYVLLGGGMILCLVRARTRQLQKRSRALEKIVEERTAEIKSTQEKLVMQSKLAALGALTAGIAHEIKNPLNFVNNFAKLSRELVQELEEELAKEPVDNAVILELLHTLQQNADKINEHGGRADSIVKSMLQHSRGKAGERQPTDINAMLEEDINLAYHGMRAQDSSFNIKIETDFDPSIGKLDLVPQDISRVFINIINNGCYEAHRKKMEQNGNFYPTLSVRTRNLQDRVEIRIRDNGNGIPEAVRDKLFTPFFTTKPAGQGTGLGLSISYEIIVHTHHGELYFESEDGEYAEFIIRLPRTK